MEKAAKFRRLAADMDIENAVKADEEAILNLLRECGLPTEGVAERIDRFLVMRNDNGAVIASAGWEGTTDVRLIRSVVRPVLAVMASAWRSSRL